VAPVASHDSNPEPLFAVMGGERVATGRYVTMVTAARGSRVARRMMAFSSARKTRET
jgi:hypothetical protein